MRGFVLASRGEIGGDIVGTSLPERYPERKVIVFAPFHPSSSHLSLLLIFASMFVSDNHQMDWKWRQKGIRHEPKNEVIYSHLLALLPHIKE